MQEYLYTSPLMYEETSKDDIKKFRANYKYERKADKVLIVSIVLFFLSIIVVFMNVPFFYVVSAIILGYIIFRLVKNLELKRRDFLSQYEKYLIKNTPEGYTSISASYPNYIKADNANKLLSFIFGDKEYFNIPYDDIISYDILVDKYLFKHSRLPEQPNKKISTYLLRIKCKSGNMVQVGYSNNNKCIKLRKSYVYQQFANTISINKICVMLDKIIKKTSKAKNKEVI